MDRVVVFGISHLGVRVATLLVEAGHRVVAVVPPGSSLRARLPPAVEVVEADLGDDRALASLLADGARALVLPAEDEHLNVRAALLAAEAAPGLRIVARLFDARLAETLESTIPALRVLSVSRLAAPAFALGAVLEAPLLALDGGTASAILRVAPAALGPGTVCEVEARDGLTVLASGDDLLPAPDSPVPSGAAAVVHAPIEVARRLGGLPPRPPATPARGAHAARTLRARLREDMVLRWTLVALAAVMVAATWWFSVVERLGPLNGLYFVVTTLTTTGYGDISLRDSGVATHVVVILLMLGGVTLSAMLFAMVTDALLRKRQDLLLGRSPTGARGHVVLCGAGDVGLRTLRELVALDERVVVVERDPAHPHLEAARDLAVAVVVADAGREETLRNAGLGAARALVCATEDDLTNLRIAIAGRGLVPGLHLVLRIFDRTFAARLERSLGIHVALSASEIAAPGFVAAAVGGGVLGALEIGGRRLVVRDGPGAGPGRALPGGGWVGLDVAADTSLTGGARNLG
jgi:Trk K+ transport system NAD-binding subunit